MRLEFAVVLPALVSMFAAFSAAEVRVEGRRATFLTGSMAVEVDSGVITRIQNKLTGSEYISGPAGSKNKDLATGLIYALRGVSKGDQPGVVGPTPTVKGAAVLTPVLKSLGEFALDSCGARGADAFGCGFKAKDGESALRIMYSLDRSTGDLMVELNGSGRRNSLAGVRFSVSPITCNGNLLVPAMGGIKATAQSARYQFEAPVWNWPTGWQIPLLIFQEPAGGLWFHTQDPERRFKSARYDEEGSRGTWAVALDTENPAPFSGHTSIRSVTWRINVYSGDWTGPVDRYRAWAHRTSGVAAERSSRPQWVNQIRLVVKHADRGPENSIEQYLDALKEVVEPAKTLLFMTDWVDSSEGAVMPHWVPSPKGIKFNTEARKRGFRTMYFANYIGMTSNHPRFQEFKAYGVRNPYTGDLEGWNLKGEWSSATDIALYYISPAAKPWRDYAIGLFKALFDKYPADGLFIDQSFLMFNDGNGLRDGKTTIDGNVAYHAALRAALPGVAIGGESINEVTMLYESFFEHHPLSLHMPTGADGKALGWQIEPGAFDRMVSILPRFLLPHTRPIGYLGFPDTSSPFYRGWRDSLQVYGGIPTITYPTLEELRDEGGEVRRVIREAMRVK